MSNENLRDELVKELSDTGCLYPKVVDFILERDKKIVEPLVKHKIFWCGNWEEYTASMPIDETLKLAGVKDT